MNKTLWNKSNSIRIASLVCPTQVDGPGTRAALFFQGCSIHCQGCQNKHLWPVDEGQVVQVSDLARQLVDTGLPLTITGGEPFDQAEGLTALLRLLRADDRHVIVYSGYTWEQLSEKAAPVQEALRLADVLVDGPYVPKLDHPGMQYRGSSNQRPIDLQATWQSGGIVTLDWDTPEVLITPTGDLLGAAGIVSQFSNLGEAKDTRHCGETE
jgi:anaerobic ribonucleoside-triphosphate reductase activating protein